MTDQPRSISVHIPVTLLALAIAVFFASQIGAATRSIETMNWQKDNSEKQIKQLEDGEKQLTELVEKRKELVGQSQKVQEQYTALLKDVLDLSKTDNDAAEVVKKYNIQQAAPPDGAKKEEKKDN
jgi:flagellar biosynthesis/type III secretory pathway M-ring protein FliF/YscJ